MARDWIPTIRGFLICLAATALAVALVMLKPDAEPATAGTPVSEVPPAPSTSDRHASSYLPNSPLKTQDGKVVRFYDDVVKDRIVVFSFIYTSCRNICPLMTSRLAEVRARMLAHSATEPRAAFAKDVAFVSISIDPIPDTPEKLRAYADAFSVSEGWTFLTGNPADIDVIRYRLGERSGQQLDMHKNEVLLYNDRTGEWARDSAMTDLETLAVTIRNMNPEWRMRSVPAGALAVDANASPYMSHSDIDAPGSMLFVKACAACHTVGKGDKVGPDLAGVLERRPREWLISFITAPDRMRAAGDKTALELEARFGAVRMPNLELSENDASDVLTFLASQSPKAKAAANDASAAKAN